MYKVRFNLGAGVRFMKWKITNPDGNHTYHEPNDVVLKLKGCKLYNNVSGAKKIKDGANKTVVAWVVAEDVEVLVQRQLQIGFDRVSYNPRVSPHWILNGQIVDGEMFEMMVSINSGLYLQ
jgi:hypothetical protein